MLYSEKSWKQGRVACNSSLGYFSTVYHLLRGSIYNRLPSIHSSNIKAPCWCTLHVNSKGEKKKQGRAKIRNDLLHQSLMFNQPAKRHLISMLMRLVQRCLYAVWLERNNNGVPIRGRCKSPIPMQHSPVAPDPLSLPNLISYRIGDAGRHQRGTYTHTNTRASHIIRSAFGPSGFYCARLENGAIKSMSEASAPFLLPRLPSAPPATN